MSQFPGSPVRIRLVGETLPRNLAEHVSFTTMTDEDRRTPEETVGANIKMLRAQRGLTQAELAEAMQGLGYSWIQTTVAKTEAADRPLRLNEVADLAQVLRVRLPELVSTDTDWALRSIVSTVDMYASHAKRLESEIEELTQQLEAKKQSLEETRKLIEELRAEYSRVNGER
jgi:transcriptional regulator with XRE-family HTH domain